MKVAHRTSWTKKKLNALGFVGRGKSRHRPRNATSLYGGHYPFIQTAEIVAADCYITTYTQTYNEKGLAQSKMWDENTLCISIAGENTAETAILKFKACFPDSVIGFIADKDKADVRFVKYALDSLKRKIKSITKGATQDNLSLEKLLSFDILTPPLLTQHKIAAIFSAYDDLIENNTRRIKILDEMAQSIYREWFVNFRFPGHEKVKMVDSPMGKIPEGWDVTSILKCPDFQLIGENIRPYEGKKVYYATADIEGTQIIGKGIEYSYDEKPSRAQKLPEMNSVWFARMQETYKVLAFTNANKILSQKCMLSSGFAGFRSFDNLTFAFLFYTINSKNFHQRKDLFCTGATQRSLTNEGLGRIQIIMPTRKMVERFSEVTQPNLEMILILQQQNGILRQTRDLLLPKLISGELDVSELDIKTEEIGK